VVGGAFIGRDPGRRGAGTLVARLLKGNVQAILEILATAGRWLLALWQKKNAPTPAQRADQISRDYAAKRRDLEKR
jgi:hypothetical protein